MTHILYEGTDHAGNFARLLLLDYSKALDLVNHNILISKLLNIGISSHFVMWLAAFLLNRTQCIKVSNAVFNEGRPKGGIPQGTVSGPKNILVHINDLQTPLPLYTYIDERNVIEVCAKDGRSSLEESLNIIVNDWSYRNDMRINPQQTTEMVVCFCKDHHHANIHPLVTNVKTTTMLISIRLSPI